MLLQLATETILGALTGYVTNDTAIRSLFQKHGVIEKTRDDFAREAGKLLEEEVLTREVLSAQLRLPEVQTLLAQALEDFIAQELPRAVRAADFTADSSSEDGESAAAALAAFLCELLSRERETLLALLRRHLPLDCWLDEAQSRRFAEQLTSLLSATLRQEQFTARFYQAWREENGARTLADLGLAPFCRAVAAQAAEMSADWQRTLLRDYGDEVERLLLESLRRLDLQPVLLELDAQMEQMRLGQYLACDAAQLAALLQRLLHSDVGDQLLQVTARELARALEQIDAPVSRLLPQEMLTALAPTLDAQLPAVLEDAAAWLQENAQSVRGMLDGAVAEVAEETGGMRGMLLSQMQDTLLSQLLEENEIGTLLRRSFSETENESGGAAQLRQLLQTVLDTRSVGELARAFNEKRRLEKLLKRQLIAGLDRLLEQRGAELLERLLNRRVGSLHLAERQPQIERLLADLLRRALAGLDLPQLLRREDEHLLNLQIGQLLSTDGARLDDLLDRLLTACVGRLAEALPELSSGTVYGALYDALEQTFAEKGADWISAWLRDLELDRLLALCGELLAPHRDALLQGLSDAGVRLLEGRLSVLAEREIQALDSDEMLRLVEDLMGRELQPLNYLGAGMGAVAGATVGTALAMSVPTAGAPLLLGGILAGKSAAFGAVGYVTNCAAVKGLFWPYAPLGGVEALQGVIPKQKARFSRSMGRLVDRYVINPDVLHEILTREQQRRDDGAARLAEADALWAYGAATISAERRSIAQALLRRLAGQDDAARRRYLAQLGDVPFAVLRGKTRPLPDLDRLWAALADWCGAQLHRDLPLASLISADALWPLAERFLTAQTLPDLAGLAQEFLRREESLATCLGAARARTLCETVQAEAAGILLTEARRARIAARLSVFFAGMLREIFAESADGRPGKASAETSADAPFALQTRFQKNVSGFSRVICEELLRFLQEQQDAITAAVQQAIWRRLSPMQMLGYGMLDGDDLAARIVERVLRQKLPVFLSVKSKELEALFWQCWRRLSPALADCAPQQSQMEAFLTRLLAEPSLHHSLGIIARGAAAIALEAPVASWGRFVQTESILNRPQMRLGLQWHAGRAEVCALWRSLFCDVYRQIIGPVPLHRWCAGYRETPPLRQMLTHSGLQSQLESLWLRLQENLSVTRVRQWFDWPRTAVAIDEGVAALLVDEDFLRWADYAVQTSVLRLCQDWQSLLPVSSRRALTQSALRAVWATAERYGAPLLQAMDLSGLAERQLLCMDSARLERVVRGFAGHYLRHIERRGWWGAGFALPGMLFYLL